MRLQTRPPLLTYLLTCSFATCSGAPLSSLHQHTGQPHKVYKYLEVYVYTQEQRSNTFDLATLEIRSFTTLQPLARTLSEHIKLVNIQQIPVLVYRRMAHPLTLQQLRRLHRIIRKFLRCPHHRSRITPKLSPKDKYTPRSKGGLGSRHFTHCILQDMIYSALRYLNRDGPPEVISLVGSALLTPQRSALPDTVVDAVEGLGLRFNTTGPWSPALPQHMLPGERVWPKFTGVCNRDCPVYQGTVQDTSATTAKLVFLSKHG